METNWHDQIDIRFYAYRVHNVNYFTHSSYFILAYTFYAYIVNSSKRFTKKPSADLDREN